MVKHVYQVTSLRWIYSMNNNDIKQGNSVIVTNSSGKKVLNGRCLKASSKMLKVYDLKKKIIMTFPTLGNFNFEATDSRQFRRANSNSLAKTSSERRMRSKLKVG